MRRREEEEEEEGAKRKRRREEDEKLPEATVGGLPLDLTTTEYITRSKCQQAAKQ